MCKRQKARRNDAEERRSERKCSREEDFEQDAFDIVLHHVLGQREVRIAIAEAQCPLACLIMTLTIQLHEGGLLNKYSKAAKLYLLISTIQWNI